MRDVFYQKKFMIVFVGIVLVLSAMIIILTHYVDPYAVNGTNVKGRKPYVFTHIEDTKLLQLQKINPKVVLLGNSRVDSGFDPLSSIWKKEDKPVYNYGIAGAGIASTYKNLQFILEVSKPKKIILSLDFLDFTKIKPKKLQEDLAKTRTDDMDLFLKTHFAQKAIFHSIGTLVQKENPYTPYITDYGFNPMDDYVKFIYDKSFGYVVEQKIRDYKKRFPKKEVSDNILDVHALDITEKIFAEAKKHNVELTVIFPPYHKTFLDILYDNNYWTSFWVWKQEVTERATKYSNVMDIWDFANYNDFTLEVIPTKSRDANDMKYFWEPGHFKKALGDEIIEMIYSKKPSDGVRHISLN